MQHYVPASIVVCLLLCLSFNYTFPLLRDTTATTNTDANSSRRYGVGVEPDVKARTFASASIFTINDNQGTKNRKPSGDDLRQYEQMVIMKKYPYLDLKEFELKYHPSGKMVRQNPRFAPERIVGVESDICEPMEDGPNVEISNRGLSGFAIPPLKVTDARQTTKKYIKKTHILDSLRQDIKEFEDKMNSKLVA